MLLGANEEQASKEMAEVMEFMENLAKLTIKHLVLSDFPASRRSMGFSQEMDVQSFMYKKQMVDKNAINKVGDLSEAFPGVRHLHHYKTNPSPGGLADLYQRDDISSQCQESNH